MDFGEQNQIITVPKIKSPQFLTILNFIEQDKTEVVTASILTNESIFQLKSV